MYAELVNRGFFPGQMFISNFKTKSKAKVIVIILASDRKQVAYMTIDILNNQIQELSFSSDPQDPDIVVPGWMNDTKDSWIELK